MSSLHNHILRNQPFVEFLGDIAALGVVPVTREGQRFSVISARSNPRWWLLPINDRHSFTSGLEMLHPVTTTARIAKSAARIWAWCGPMNYMTRNKILLSGSPVLCGVFDENVTSIAYFTGTDGPHRKTAFQIMGRNGRIMGYGKVSRANHVRPYLRNEANILTHVGAMGLRSVDVPKVKAFRDEPAATLLVTDSLKSATQTVPLVPGLHHFAFLSEIRAQTERLGAAEALDELAHSADLLDHDWTARLKRLETALRPHAESIPVCLAHGDFTPWNTFLQSERLYVFDWEYARQKWPVGFDHVHFLLSTTPHSKQPDRVDELIRVLAQAHFANDTRQATRALLLSLACHAAFYLIRLLDTGSPSSEWRDGVARAAMIDRLLDLGASRI